MSEKLIGVPLPELAPFCRRVAAEGAVLLRNEEKLLPLAEGEKVSVFGRCQIEYYRSGTGSGGAVNVEYETNVIDSLKESGRVCVNEALEKTYREWLVEHPFDNGGGGWAAEPWNQEEMPLTDEIVRQARAFAPKAIFIIGRTAGEDKDNVDAQGSYRLTDTELSNLHKLSEYYNQIIVLLNVANVIDMSWLLQENLQKSVKTLMYVWQGGMEGGHAVADVLTGKVNPSGRLVNSIAYSLSDYPSSKNFGVKSLAIYEEDIYVGYRYFETFAPNAVWFPFGYGISYTTFALSQQKAVTREGKICVSVMVENTGNVTGKQCVQLYMEAPQGMLGRAAKELVGFAKTRELAPGEKEQLVIEVDLHRFAAYDDGGVTGHKSCYVLEAGCYRFYLGENVRDAKAVAVDGKEGYSLEELVVVKQLEEAMAPNIPFRRMKPGQRGADGIYELTYEFVPTMTINLKDRILSRLPKELPQTGRKGMVLKDVEAGKVTMDEFIAQFSNRELASMVRGEGMSSPKATPGTASAFGGMNDPLEEYGIPVACTSDGPSGIRMESGLKATQMPIGTLLACTWNPEIIEELYTLEGKELLRNEIDSLLGPGINIHRNPLNGRNFEYFSEDPYLTGCFATAAIKGLHKGGSSGTLKHFAANNQETDRYLVNSVVSERALREIYLKGFEMAVKDGHAISVMTSYNPVNGFQAASNYDLATTILRGEWGFQGIVMTDWWAFMNDVTEYGPGGRKDTASMVRSQNDLYMVVDNNGAWNNAAGDNIEEALENGKLTVAELQRSAKNICTFILQAPCFGRDFSAAKMTKVYEPTGTSMTEKTELTDKAHFDIVDGVKMPFHVEKEGIYRVYAHVMSPLKDLSQTTTNVLLGDQVMTTIQIGGTDSKWVTHELLKVGFKSGDYEMDLEYAKAGMQVAWIELERVSEEKAH